MNDKFGFVIIIIGLIGAVFFWEYEGEGIPYPMFWELVFIGLILLGIKIQRAGRNIKESNEIIESKRNFEAFKSEANRITVVLSECKILSNSYNEHVDNANNDEWEAMMNPYEPVVEEEVNVFVLAYEIDYEGESTTFYSVNIYRDEVDLKMKLFEQKETQLYVDKQDKNQYHFDLSFMNTNS